MIVAVAPRLAFHCGSQEFVPMRGPALLLAVACSCLAAGGLSAAEESGDADRIARLMTQLGSDKCTERDEASKTLDGIGARALESLKKGTNSPDLEVKRRSLALVKKIETRLESEKLLAPTRLRLRLDDFAL